MLGRAEMKRAILIATTMLATFAVSAHASEQPLNILLTGDAEANSFGIGLTADGTTYLISSSAPLEIGGVCTHPEGDRYMLSCPAPQIGSFEVNAGPGDDAVQLAGDVPVPVTLRGDPGDDRLVSGAGADKLIGGPGDDALYGRAGNDWLFGGPGGDRLVGGLGDDVLRGGPGVDATLGGPGKNKITP
jgi:hypothetical protein